MSSRKRVTLTFEIDDHDGYNDAAFMRRDFLQELSCCVNNPCEDTFMMKVENVCPFYGNRAKGEWIWNTHEGWECRCSRCGKPLPILTDSNKVSDICA